MAPEVVLLHGQVRDLQGPAAEPAPEPLPLPDQPHHRPVAGALCQVAEALPQPEVEALHLTVVEASGVELVQHPLPYHLTVSPKPLSNPLKVHRHQAAS